MYGSAPNLRTCHGRGARDAHIQISYNTDAKPPQRGFLAPARAPLSPQTRRGKYGAILRSWIGSCATLHADCVAAGSTLPTGVLDVGDSEDAVIFLRLSPSATDRRYVALSHCWGSSALPQALTTNLEERKIGIEVASLLKNFQNAVSVTRSIGVRYLWINSLCILQDSTLDWEIESSNMAEIYNNAYLVLAASQAADSTVGFIDRLGEDWRQSMLNSSNVTRIGQIRNPDSSVTEIFRRLLSGCFYNDRHHKVVINSTLAQRAWALQENMLARRIVHFTQSEMMWGCVESL
ncbi:heterokaryon incompatibility protein-domain-containing protein [Immersiella caudata]|uniref:Heterokaryon incompatibility protein-domain-containing protein n=1 Tax=Immersiella caudata TaxID=314043 RepID=A0AA39WKJ0_9PEZI|nr:heterokaryon incompatibility protein-domain-containing protein [Immersiella caudata]